MTDPADIKQAAALLAEWMGRSRGDAGFSLWRERKPRHPSQRFLCEVERTVREKELGAVGSGRTAAEAVREAVAEAERSP